MTPVSQDTDSPGRQRPKEIASPRNFHPRTGTPTPGQELLPLKLSSDRTPEGIRDPEMVQAPPNVRVGRGMLFLGT